MASSDYGRPIKVLLVEDDPGDVDLTREVLAPSKLRMDLDVVEDGAKAMRYLRRERPYADKPRPDLILLDLNMPRKSGRDVLREVKNSEELCTIPVVVLTTSDRDKDVAETYALGANCYVTKPVGLEQFSRVVNTIRDFWLTIVKFPRQP